MENESNSHHPLSPDSAQENPMTSGDIDFGLPSMSPPALQLQASGVDETSETNQEFATGSKPSGLSSLPPPTQSSSDNQKAVASLDSAPMQRMQAGNGVMQLRRKQASLERRQVKEYIENILDRRPEISTIDRKPDGEPNTSFRITLNNIPVGDNPDWIICFTFNELNNHNVDTASQFLTIDLDNPDMSEQEENIFKNEIAERINHLFVTEIVHRLNPAAEVGGVFIPGGPDNDLANLNAVDKSKLKLLDQIANQYQNTFNTNHQTPNHANRAAAVTAKDQLLNLIRRMGLYEPEKLALLGEQNEEDIANDPMNKIKGLALNESYDRYEVAQAGGGGGGGPLPDAYSGDTMEHLTIPSGRNNAAQFKMMGIGGGHEDSQFKDFVSNNDQFQIKLIKTEVINTGGDTMTLRMYDQFLVQGGVRTKSDAKKTTTDNLNMFLYLNKQAMPAGPIPGDGDSYGNFAENGAPKATAGDVDFGGYGHTNELTGANGLQTAFVTDSWFFEKMAAEGKYYDTSNADRRRVMDAFLGMPKAQRDPIVPRIMNFATRLGYAGFDEKLAEEINARNESHRLWIVVSNIESSVRGKVNSKKSQAPRLKRPMNAADFHLIDVICKAIDQRPAAGKFGELHKGIEVSKNSGKSLLKLKTYLANAITPLSQSINVTREFKTLIDTHNT